MATPENGTNLSEDLDIEGPQTSLLTADEQSAIYKQASLLAIYAMSNKNGATKAKEMLAVVTKVKNFLTNLVQLAGNSGPQVKTAVHSLVQKLVVRPPSLSLSLFVSSHSLPLPPLSLAPFLCLFDVWVYVQMLLSLAEWCTCDMYIECFALVIN